MHDTSSPPTRPVDLDEDEDNLDLDALARRLVRRAEQLRAVIRDPREPMRVLRRRLRTLRSSPGYHRQPTPEEQASS